MARRRNEYIGRAKARSLRIRGNAATAGSSRITTVLEGSATWDAGNLIDAAGESKDVTVTGAALGDFAIASLGVDSADLTVTANVTAANTVTVRAQNESGGAVDLASTTVKVLVLKTSTAV